MKKFPLAYLRAAQLDLIEAFKYIQDDSPAQAKIWLERVDRTIGRLAAFPESGAVPKDERLAALGYRVVVVGEYLVFYVFLHNRVEVRRVLHGRQRYLFLL
jgi:plasmid stabilization system protein ParE